MNIKSPLRRAAALGLAGLLATPAFAVDLRPDAVMVQAAVAPHGTAAAGVGAVWDWGWQWPRRALFTGQTELILSHWRADAVGGGSQSLQQMTLLPVFRLNLDQGRSPWYLELGIGASYLSRDYVTPNKTFSTRWNFYDMVGGGYKFGTNNKHELGLRYVHISNLSIRKPNPGEDFLQLRYAMKF